MFRSAALFLPSPSQKMGRVARAAMACSALALLSACGGGDRAEPYQPDRVVVFGDEHSAFAPDEAVVGGVIKGLTYTINSVFDVTGYCADNSTIAPCGTSDFLGGTITDFEAGDNTRPYGTGYLLQTSSDVVNTVYLLTPGTVTHVPADASAPVTNVKRDRRVFYNCAESQTAFQRIAHAFNKGFSGSCPLEANGGATSFAASGNKIADLQAQVNQASGQGLLGKGALVTVWIGQNDIIEIVEAPGLATLASKRLEAKARAERLAQLVLQIYRTGAKVIVIGATDLSYSPWAVNRGATDCGAAVAPCPHIQAVVNDFNKTLELGDLKTKDNPDATGYVGLSGLAFRGRDNAFVDAARSMRDFATNGAYNFTRGACVGADMSADAGLLNRAVKPDGTLADIAGGAVQFCTRQSLVADAGADTYLWADDRRLAPVAHQAIANAALVRAVNQF